MGVKERVNSPRARMRERGYRMVQIWVPDVRAANFENEARRQAAAVAEGDRRSDDQAFIESVSASWDE